MRLRSLNLSDNYLKSNQLGFLSTAQASLGDINLSNNLLTSDGDGPDPDLPLATLNVHGQNAFRRTLRLSDNKIEQLPDNVFAGNYSLNALELANNQIRRLQNGALDGIKWVASSWSSGGVLRLNGNPLTTIDVGAFNDAPCGSPVSWDTGFSATNCLHYLHLEDGLLESLPSTVFSGLTELRELGLNGNRLTTIPARLYDGLTKVTVVSLQDNLIASIADSAFEDLSGLTALDLRSNALTFLNAEVFDGLPKHSSGANMGLLQRPSSLDLRGNTFDAEAVTALRALFPNGHDVRTGPLAAVPPRTLTPDDGTRETLANCGPGHTLTGRTAEVVYRIMRAAYNRASEWPTLVGLNHPQYNRNWDRTLALHQLRYGATPSLGDPPATYPALCNLFTADELLRVNGLSVGNITAIKSLEARDFAGLFNMVSLQIYSSTFSITLRELPEGIFDGLTKLRSLTVRGSDLLELRPAVFNRLSDLRTLDLSHNMLTTLPAGVFDRLTRLHTMSLNDNKISSLPTGLFARLTSLRRLWIQRNKLDADDIPVGTFNGLSNLREISLRSNNVDSLWLEVFANQGLTMLKTLRISEQQVGRATSGQFEQFEQSLPSLVRLDRSPGQDAVPTPTPIAPTATPTFTPTPRSVTEPLITRIEPQVRELTITAGSEIRLAFNMYNYRNWLDNELFRLDRLRIVWTTTGDGRFSESPGEGSNMDGEVNDREVVWHAPDQAGAYTVTGYVYPYGSCSGGDLECQAVFRVTVTAGSVRGTPEPTPCASSSAWPTTVTDSDENEYAVFTPAEGGDSLADGVWVTALRGALIGCGYVGIRAYALPGRTAAGIVGRWVTDGGYYGVDVVGQSAEPLNSFVTRRPVEVCVPMPDRFRASLSDLTLLREFGGNPQELTSKVRRHNTEGFKVCGAVSEFPAVVVAASRNVQSATTDVPTPTPVAETPDAGGGSPSGAYVLLVLVLGALAAAGAMRVLGSINRDVQDRTG